MPSTRPPRSFPQIQPPEHPVNGDVWLGLDTRSWYSTVQTWVWMSHAAAERRRLSLALRWDRVDGMRYRPGLSHYRRRYEGRPQSWGSLSLRPEQPINGDIWHRQRVEDGVVETWMFRDEEWHIATTEREALDAYYSALRAYRNTRANVARSENNSSESTREAPMPRYDPATAADLPNISNGRYVVANGNSLLFAFELHTAQRGQIAGQRILRTSVNNEDMYGFATLMRDGHIHVWARVADQFESRHVMFEQISRLWTEQTNGVTTSRRINMSDTLHQTIRRCNNCNTLMRTHGYQCNNCINNVSQRPRLNTLGRETRVRFLTNNEEQSVRFSSDNFIIETPIAQEEERADSSQSGPTARQISDLTPGMVK